MTKLPKNEEKVLLALFEREDVKSDEIAAATGLSRSEVLAALASLKEQGMVGGPPSLLEHTMGSLRELDGNLNPTDAGYAETIILMASMLSKSDERFLAEELGYDKEFVGTVGARLRASGVWKGDAITQEHLSAWCKDGGAVAFFLDAAVAQGDMMVVGHGTDGPQYKMTPGGRTHVENLMRH